MSALAMVPATAQAANNCQRFVGSWTITNLMAFETIIKPDGTGTFNNSASFTWTCSGAEWVYTSSAGTWRMKLSPDGMRMVGAGALGETITGVRKSPLPHAVIARPASASHERADPPALLSPEPTAPPSHTASQQDWDDCAARSIPACTRLISDQGQSATDRPDAYLFRASAHLAEADLDGAIADYNEAIKLAPTNIVAYSSRALAYFRKGDRDRAILDYNAAARIDPKGLTEIAAGNAEIAAIARAAR
jgi:hypothetical protein